MMSMLVMGKATWGRILSINICQSFVRFDIHSFSDLMTYASKTEEKLSLS